MNTPIEVLSTYLMSSIPFFIVTWEEYVTGVMELSSFSGVDEGAVVCSMIFFLSGILEESFWSKTIFEIKYNIILISSLILVSAYFMYIR